MSEFSVKILGCGSATPSMRHNPSSQVVCHKSNLYMIDCGEGTQLQLRRMGVSFAKIRHIFISHLHGDHMLGLPGLLSTLALHNIESTVHVYMFEEGIRWIEEFSKISQHHQTLDVVWHPIRRERAVVLDNKALTVETIPLYHSVPCVGYIFREKPKLRKIKGDIVEHFKVPNYLREGLRRGDDFVTADGEVIANKRLTLDPDPALSYAYCSDTLFSRQVVADVRDVSTLYHESTYADDRKKQAEARGHSTARQAAIVAREAGVDQLILGHFSKSYTDGQIFLKEAREEFPNVVLADEGKDIPII